MQLGEGEYRSRKSSPLLAAEDTMGWISRSNGKSIGIPRSKGPRSLSPSTSEC